MESTPAAPKEDATAPKGEEQAASPPAAHPTTLNEAKKELRDLIEKQCASKDEYSDNILALQRACMRLPLLSTVLVPDTRLKLYLKLLSSFTTVHAALPESLSEVSDRVSERHEEVAKVLAEAMGSAAAQHLGEKELAEFVCYLGTVKGLSFEERRLSALAAVATQLRDLTPETKREKLNAFMNIALLLQRDYFLAALFYEKVSNTLLRLLLQYHDPVLSVHLEQQQVDVSPILLEWCNRFFVLNKEYDNALHIIDWVLIIGDPLLTCFVALAYLLTHRQTFLALKSKEALTTALASLSLKLSQNKHEAVNPQLADGRRIALVPVWSGKTLLQNADLLFRNTPLSCQRSLENCLFPEAGATQKTPEALERYYSSMPCLTVERSDIAHSFAADPREDVGIDYVVVDCRSQASYDYARLPGAIFVGDDLGYEPEQLTTLEMRLESARGSHLCVFGTGRPITEEVNLLKLIALHLIKKKQMPYVGYASGGFKSIIPLIRNQSIRMVMANAPTTPPDTAPFASTALDAALDKISSYLPMRDDVMHRADEVRHKAQELGEAAREKAEAARSWGWSLLQKVQDTLGDVQDPVGEAQENRTAGAAAPAATGGKAKRAAPQRSAPKRPAVPQPFSVEAAADDEDDDFGLITSVPQPMKSSLPDVPAEAGAAAAAAKHADPAAAPAAAPAAKKTAKPAGKKSTVDEEFDKLFE